MSAGGPIAPEDTFDAIVVGSGFGGAVTAYRLADAGWKVLVLERGRPWPPGSFPRTPRRLQQAFWDPPSGRHGLFDIWAFSGMNVVTASGLGGGSLIYSNVMLPKPASTFAHSDTEQWPLTRADLNKHYDNVRDVQRPQVYPADVAPYDEAGRVAALEDAAGRLGHEVRRPPLAVLFAAERGEAPVPRAPVDGPVASLHGLPRTTCRLCAECNLGCNDGAKQTVDHTYLSRAVDPALPVPAQIRTLCEVRTLTDLGDGEGWAVGYRQHLDGLGGVAAGLRDPTAETERTVRAAHVVLAAGTVGTTRLLLRNRAALPKLSPTVGRRVSGNGDLLMFARDTREGEPRDSDRPWRYLDPSYGPAISTSVHVPAGRSSSGREYYVQDSGAPGFTEWMWQGVELPHDLWAERGVAWRRLRDRLTGHRDSNVSGELAGLFGSAHASAAMMPMLGMGQDVADGRLHLDRDGRLDMDWDPKASEPHYEALRTTAGELARGMGGEFSVAPSAHLTTVHPVGGCAMATDRTGGVVDPWGRVHGHPGLHVADGSVMPGPVGPNPSFTIAALADRFAEQMIEDRR